MPVRSLRRARVAASLLAALVVVTGCGDDTSDPSEPARIEKAEIDNGDEQDGIASFALDAPLRVRVTRDNRPAADVLVSWSTEDGGEMSPSVTVTDADGIAQTQWILGPAAGDQTAAAGIEEDDVPVVFTATAIVPEEPATTTIQVSNNEFVPQNVTVRVNRSVTWVWDEGAVAHNIVPSDGLIPEPSGPPVPAPKTFVYVFKAPGVYTYYCEVHGSSAGSGMAGTVTVVGADD